MPVLISEFYLVMNLIFYAVAAWTALPVMTLAMPVAKDTSVTHVGDNYILDPCGFKKRDDNEDVKRLEIVCPE